MTNKTPISIISFPRSGTHLAIDLIRLNFPTSIINKKFFQSNDHVYLNLERTTSNSRPLTTDQALKRLQLCENPLIKTHYDAHFETTWHDSETGAVDPKLKQLIQSCPKIYIYRKTYKVLISYYNLLATIDKDIMDFETFIKDTNILDKYIQHLTGWISAENVLTFSYSTLVDQPEFFLDSIQNNVNIKRGVFRKPPHLKSIRQSRFQRIFAISPKSTAIVTQTNIVPEISVEIRDIIDAKIANSNLPIKIKSHLTS